jgi:hypothetical protein
LLGRCRHRPAAVTAAVAAADTAGVAQGRVEALLRDSIRATNVDPGLRVLALEAALQRVLVSIEQLTDRYGEAVHG